MPRVRNRYDPSATEPFRLSRSKVEDYLRCPRCFYLDRRLGVGRPSSPPFSINIAVDALLKREFDAYRAAGTPHPLMVEAGIDAVPYQHQLLDRWRSNFQGIQVQHAPTNLLLTGAVDDLWVTPAKELIVVDYKATAKAGEVSLDAPWQVGYKRQAEFYQWLLRQSGFTVHPTAWFVYCNGDLTRPDFDARVEFSIRLLPYEGDDRWVAPVLEQVRDCLRSNELPPRTEGCEFCAYRASAQTHEGVS